MGQYVLGGVRVAKVTYGAPELLIVASSDDSAFGIRTKQLLDMVERSDQLLAVRGIEPVLGRLAHGDDEDLPVAVDREVIIRKDRGRGRHCLPRP